MELDIAAADKTRHGERGECETGVSIFDRNVMQLLWAECYSVSALFGHWACWRPDMSGHTDIPQESDMYRFRCTEHKSGSVRHVQIQVHRAPQSTNREVSDMYRFKCTEHKSGSVQTLHYEAFWLEQK
eukprot:5569430-Amphidinium_carterae.1